MTGVQFTFLMFWYHHIDEWSTSVIMITLMIQTGITPEDLEFRLKYPTFHEHLHQCAVNAQIVTSV